MPSPPAVAPADLLTCSAIAELIAGTRGNCNRSSVWRAIKRLKISPALIIGKYSFYTQANAETISTEMRRHNGKGA